MAIYQCFFFLGGRIEYWENIECETCSSLKLVLDRRVSDENWDVVEAWKDNQLIYRSAKLPDGRTEHSFDLSEAANGNRRLRSSE